VGSIVADAPKIVGRAIYSSMMEQILSAKLWLFTNFTMMIMLEHGQVDDALFQRCAHQHTNVCTVILLTPPTSLAL
jgi:hypothetical protein